jgi:hypothetical protein
MQKHTQTMKHPFMMKPILLNPAILVVNYKKPNTFFNKIIGYNDNIKKRQIYK